MQEYPEKDTGISKAHDTEYSGGIHLLIAYHKPQCKQRDHQRACGNKYRHQARGRILPRRENAGRYSGDKADGGAEVSKSPLPQSEYICKNRSHEQKRTCPEKPGTPGAEKETAVRQPSVIPEKQKNTPGK